MKKTLILVSLVLPLMVTNVFAQYEYPAAIQKGSVLTGGSAALSFGTSKNEFKSQWANYESEVGYTSFSLTPKAGFFVVNGLALGVVLDLTTTSYKDKEDDSKSASTQYSLGPMIRYYTAGGFFVFADILFGKNTYKETWEGGEDKSDSNLSKWQLGIGYAFFLNDFVSIEPGIMYRSTASKYKGDSIEYNSQLGEFVLGVGFSIFLHKRTE
jgi:outer membrane protein